MIVESKPCFHCGETKPLEEFRETFKKYSRPEHMGRCIGCKVCTTPEAMEERRISKYPAHGRWIKWIPKVKKRSIVK